MNIAIFDNYRGAIRNLDCFRKISGHNVTIWDDHPEDIDVLAERLKDTEALVPIRERTAIRAPLLDRLPNLKIISQRGATPHIDVDACTERGVVLSSSMPVQGEQGSYATAELTLALMMAAMRQIPQQMASLKAGMWQTGVVGLGMRGRTLGVFGYGKIGAMVAGYGRALGMKVLVWGREGSLVRAQADGHSVADSKEAFFKQTDIVTLHIRLVDDTRGIVTGADLARMKPTAVIINTSRAGLIEPGALETALRAGRPGMAGVDVYEKEPLTSDNHPLFALNNVVCTPHIGFVERDALEIRFSRIFDQILAYLAGQPINVVNPQALNATRNRSYSR